MMPQTSANNPVIALCQEHRGVGAIRWAIDKDIIRDRHFDFAMKFPPDSVL